MPRDGAGNASILNAFSPGTVISSTEMNANFNDIASMLTASLPRDGQAGMTGQFKAASGTEDLPGIAFLGDLDTGIFRSGANEIAIVTAGAAAVTIDASGDVDFAGALTVSGDAVAVTTAPNTFTAAQTFAGGVTLVDDDAGAGGGPILTLDRNSATPAANDGLGVVRFTGRNDAAATITYAEWFGVLADETDGTEDGALVFRTMQNGTLGDRMHIGAGVWMQGATGGDPGAGGLNAASLHINGVRIHRSAALYQNRQASGTAGPTFTTGSWQTYPLTDEVSDPDNIASLGSNQITIATAGTYDINASILPGFNSSSRTRHGVRLRDVTNNVTLLSGTNVSSATADPGGEGSIIGRFTLAGSAALEIQLFPTNANPSSGFPASSNGEIEVYASVLIHKVAG